MALNRSINPGDKKGAKISIWTQLNHQNKEELKMTSLRLLIDKSEKIQNASAILISGVFIMDRIFDNKW